MDNLAISLVWGLQPPIIIMTHYPYINDQSILMLGFFFFPFLDIFDSMWV